MEELLESFVTAALGLELKSRICDETQLEELQLGSNGRPPDAARVCAAWDTIQSRVTICATYHAEHSRRMKCYHVLWLEWWIPPQVHHEGWWRVEHKWPRNWIKGHG
jgi:hypothetical protein